MDHENRENDKNRENRKNCENNVESVKARLIVLYSLKYDLDTVFAGFFLIFVVLRAVFEVLFAIFAAFAVERSWRSFTYL